MDGSSLLVTAGGELKGDKTFRTADGTPLPSSLKVGDDRKHVVTSIAILQLVSTLLQFMLAEELTSTNLQST